MTHAIAYSLLPELASAFKDPVEGTFALKVKIDAHLAHDNIAKR